MNKYEQLGRTIIEKEVARKAKDFDLYTSLMEKEHKLTKELENDITKQPDYNSHATSE